MKKEKSLLTAMTTHLNHQPSLLFTRNNMNASLPIITAMDTDNPGFNIIHSSEDHNNSDCTSVISNTGADLSPTLIPISSLPINHTQGHTLTPHIYPTVYQTSDSSQQQPVLILQQQPGSTTLLPAIYPSASNGSMPPLNSTPLLAPMSLAAIQGIYFTNINLFTFFIFTFRCRRNLLLANTVIG